MKRIVIGGNFGEAKKSSVAKKLATELFADCYNGGSLKELDRTKEIIKDYDVVVWMTNISNEVEKDYPKKKKGSILICSKFIHDDKTTGDAVARIFKMNANAVIAIIPNDNGFSFKLLDALGNLWVDTEDIHVLSNTIEKLANWTKNSIRKNSKFTDKNYFESKKVEDKFCQIVKTVSQKVEKERGGRYFGNASTRCSFMFPTSKFSAGLPHFPGGNVFMNVSGRNMPKEHLKPEDFVSVYEVDDEILYENKNIKPSVDTPVQLELYKIFPTMNYAIHGHAYIDGARFTNHYYPCGDMREVEAIKEIIESKNGLFCVNLRNHGFLIMAEDLDQLEEFIKVTKFEYRTLEEKL